MARVERGRSLSIVRMISHSQWVTDASSPSSSRPPTWLCLSRPEREDKGGGEGVVVWRSEKVSLLLLSQSFLLTQTSSLKLLGQVLLSVFSL